MIATWQPFTKERNAHTVSKIITLFKAKPLQPLVTQNTPT